MERFGIKNKPECVSNCYESGFLTDPLKWKYVGPVGQKSIQVTHGDDRENTTVLRLCCPDGTSLDPLSIFQEKISSPLG